MTSPTPPRMRAGTSDRQAAVDGLTRHFTEGRLDPTEFDERVGKAYAATYLDELPTLFADLPEASPRRGPGAGVGRPGHDGAAAFPPAGRTGPWSGPARPPFHRPPRILVLLPVIVVIAMLFSMTAMTHGFFLFPLIWIAMALLFMGRGARRRRWEDYHSRHNRW
jgi:Domain of unknown function (DUF1707)